MSVKSAQSATILFTTSDPTTSAATNADSTPAGTLYVNGTANGATVTVTNITTGVYKAALTLPALSAGDLVSLRIAASVSGVAAEGVVWQEVADTSRLSDIDADVWAYATRTLTQAAAAVTAAVSGSDLTLHRGDSFSAALTGLGDISGRSKLWFTVKTAYHHADNKAVIQIEETAGLVYLNGADASARAANGDITVNDASAGNITITLDEVETDDLDVVTGLYYDVQMLTSGEVVTTMTSGSLTVSADVTRTVA